MIYFQDDDLIFTEHEKLLAAYEPGKLISNMSRGWINDLHYWDLAFTGAGSLVDRILPAQVLQRYLDVYPKDELFLNEAAMIFGVLTPYKRIDFGFEILPAASNDNRMWKQDWHQAAKWQAAWRARSLRTVCLVMMVINEEETIGAALRSAAGMYDMAMILDTGSTDRTIEVANEVLSALSIPTHIAQEPFVDFATTRNRSLEIARKSGCDYLLLMDGDETFVGYDGRRLVLDRDAALLDYDQDLSVPQPRIVRAWQPWEYRGRVHATLYCDEMVWMEKLPLPKVQHHGATRHVHEKLGTDIEILREMHVEDPTNARTVFLLAKALEGVGKIDEAIAYYHRRTQMGGWDEESWYAQYKYGALLSMVVGYEVGAYELLKAWRLRPLRAEPLHTLALFSEDVCSQLAVPVGDLLFVQRSLYGK